MNKIKIGQEIIAQEEYEIETELSKTKLTVKVGDRGFVDSKGLLHYINGEARDKIVMINNVEINGYDYENIARLIYRKLNFSYPLSDMFEDYDIDSSDFKETIEDVSSDIF